MADRSIIGNEDHENNYNSTTRTGTNNATSSVMRDYRKGNWTVSETMVLIEAKKMDDERRTVKRSPGMAGEKTSMEPRWKWVEEYCLRKGCYRSQNQCNDKWDNLMRDYKKTRDNERRRTGNGSGGGGNSGRSSSSSYWKMENTERKEWNLPANMIPQIYEALADVVKRKGVGVGEGSTAGTTTSQLLLPGIAANAVTLQLATMLTPLPPPPPQKRSYFPSPALVAVPDRPALPLPSGLPPPLPQEGVEPPQHAFTASRPPQSMRDSEDTTQEHSDSPVKKRRTVGGGLESGTSETRDVGTAISSGATIMADAIQACDEREERRHRDTVSLHERRLRIEESKNEINRQGINGLVDAINRLASSIQALASSSSSSSASASKDSNDNNPPPP